MGDRACQDDKFLIPRQPANVTSLLLIAVPVCQKQIDGGEQSDLTCKCTCENRDNDKIVLIFHVLILTEDDIDQHLVYINTLIFECGMSQLLSTSEFFC